MFRDKLWKKILLILLVLTFLISLYRIPPTDPSKQVEIIYKNLLRNVGSGNMPKLDIKEDGQVNAWNDGTTITITTGFLKSVNYDKNQIAMTLSHELAHSILGHLSYSIDHTILLREAEADKYGAFIMLKAGYDICEGRKVFIRFIELWGDSPIMDHPSHAYRLNQLKMPWCASEE